jgi:hypothetical protein
MKDISQTPGPSLFTRKRIAVAIAILTLCGLGAWMTVEMALRMTSGQS